jgi:hypothetical protein
MLTTLQVAKYAAWRVLRRPEPEEKAMIAERLAAFYEQMLRIGKTDPANELRLARAL